MQTVQVFSNRHFMIQFFVLLHDIIWAYHKQIFKKWRKLKNCNMKKRDIHTHTHIHLATTKILYACKRYTHHFIREPSDQKMNQLDLSYSLAFSHSPPQWEQTRCTELFFIFLFSNVIEISCWKVITSKYSLAPSRTHAFIQTNKQIYIYKNNDDAQKSVRQMVFV